MKLETMVVFFIMLHFIKNKLLVLGEKLYYIDT